MAKYLIYAVITAFHENEKVALWTKIKIGEATPGQSLRYGA